MAPSDLVRGHLEMLLLSLVADGPAHGYALVEALRDRSGALFDLPEGTVYPALHRLEAAGLLASSWSEGSGRRRRVYGLTKRGRSVLRAKEQEWTTFVAAVQAVLRGAAWPTTTT
jgi:DNA-binding PadR family transcriptional regulator